MKMERRASVVRGWPYDGALDRAEVIKTGSTLLAGDFVAKQSDGTVDKSAALSATNKSVGLVVQGNGDSTSATNSGKAVVLWSGFIVELDSTCYDAGAWAPGLPVKISGTNAGKLTIANGTTDIEFGVVLDVVAASSTETAHITVLVK